MSTLQKYKPIPPLEKLNPGYIPGWKYDVLILQAEPVDKIGSIFTAESTKEDEKAASTVARIVALSPLAFKHADWPLDLDAPYEAGDIVLCKRYPAGLKVKGLDDRDYMVVKDEEIVGKRIESAWPKEEEVAAPLPPIATLLRNNG